MPPRRELAVVTDPALAETLAETVSTATVPTLERARDQVRDNSCIVTTTVPSDPASFARDVAPAPVLYVGGESDTLGALASVTNADWVPDTAAEAPTWLVARIDRLRERVEAGRARDRHEAFVEVISHDLRNPLHVAHSTVELLDRDDEHIDRLDRSLDRIARLVEDGVTFVRQSPSAIDPTVVSFAGIAREAWPNDEGLELTSTEYVRADADALGRLLTELFENALDHGRPPVTAGTTDAGFYVADDGPGIESPTRALEPGYSQTPQGTGLGLSIVREIARAHGWTVSIEDGQARVEVVGVVTE